MAGEIWGSGVNLAFAALRQKSHEMNRLEADMVAMDKPGFTRTIQDSSLYYADGKAIGITEGELQEVTDVGAENQLRSIAAQAKRATALVKYFSEYEQAFGQMGGNNAFIASGNKVVTTINTLCSQGGDSPANKRTTLDALSDHTKQMNILANKLQDLRNAASKEITNQISPINQLLTDIAAINASIDTPGATSASNISYMRQRRAKLSELAEHLEIKVQEKNADSDFLVYTPRGRVLVQKSLASEFAYDSNTEKVTLKSLAIDTTNAEGGIPPLGGTDYYYRREEAFIFDVTSDFSSAQGGALSGLMSFLQSDAVTFAQQLDAYAAGFRDSFNEVHNLGSAIQPRATLQGSAGYIGGDTLTGDLAITAAGILRVAVVDTATNLATASADIDLSGVTTVDNTADNTSLCYLINNNPTLVAHVTASIVNGSLQIAALDPHCGLSLGSVSSSLSNPPTINNFGFSEFFHLNDVVTSSSSTPFYRGGTVTGLASTLCINSNMLNNPEYFSTKKLRDDVLGITTQAVSGDPSIGRSLSDLFTRTTTSFQTPTGGTISQTLEAFSSGLVKYAANKASTQQTEKEAQIEAYKQQEALFSQEYGMDEQEIAIRSMEISKSQDLYFSFMNNYWRMMSRIAEMGK